MPLVPITEHRRLLVALVVLVAGAGLLAAWRWIGAPAPPVALEQLEAGTAVAGLAPEPPVEPAAPPERPDTITVHVVGPVREPGVVVLPSGSRVVDAITASGGLAGGGSPADGVNLARLLTDGELLDLRAPQSAGAAASAPAEPAALDLNTASAEQLQQLPGVGPVLAERILTYRQQVGGFATVEQLQEVPGIGPTRFGELQEQVRVGAG
jgi:competence protein ComEA